MQIDNPTIPITLAELLVILALGLGVGMMIAAGTLMQRPACVLTSADILKAADAIEHSRPFTLTCR